MENMNDDKIAIIAGLIPSVLTFVYGVLTLLKNLKKPDITYTEMLEIKLKEREAKLAEVLLQVAKLNEQLRDAERNRLKGEKGEPGDKGDPGDKGPTGDPPAP